MQSCREFCENTKGFLLVLVVKSLLKLFVCGFARFFGYDKRKQLRRLLKLISLKKKKTKYERSNKNFC